jgi:hypothetical protein
MSMNVRPLPKTNEICRCFNSLWYSGYYNPDHSPHSHRSIGRAFNLEYNSVHNSLAYIHVYHRSPSFLRFSFPFAGNNLFRLGLNISATRLILSEGYAGKVIECLWRVCNRRKLHCRCYYIHHYCSNPIGGNNQRCQQGIGSFRQVHPGCHAR